MLFNGSVRFHLRQLLKGTFGTLVLYTLRLRCLAISNTYEKTAFVFWAKHKLSKTTLSTIQKALFEACFACSSVVSKQSRFENFLRSLFTWNNTCFLFKCSVTFWLGWSSEAMFATMALYILRLRCLGIPLLIKTTAFDILWTWSL